MTNEKRLIDANDLKKNQTVLWDEALGFSECVLVEDIDNAPTVDAREVVHGRWIPSKSMALSDKCSVCHGWVTRHSVNERKYRYCPNCGAKMDGGVTDVHP